LELLVPEFELATGCQFEILQVKEKFGGLRFYVNGANDTIRRSLEAAVRSIAGSARSMGVDVID